MKKVFQVLDPLQVLGFTLSIAVPLYLLLTGKDQISSVTLGFVLAAFTQLLDLQVRQSQSEKRILSSKVLNEALYGDEFLVESLHQIARDSQKIKSRSFDPFEFKTLSREYLLEYRNKLTSMANGYEILVNQAPFEQSIIALRKSRKTVKITDSTDPSYWEDVNASKYIQLHKEVLKRGVKITRVFVQPMSLLSQTIDSLKKQQDLGIDVYIVASTRGETRALNDDYVLVDDSFAAISIIGANGRRIKNRVTIEEIEVDNLAKNFERLLNDAITLDEMIERLSGSS